MPHFSWQNDTLILHCHVQPKASRDEIVGLYNDALKIRIQAPPVDGKANEHLLAYLSKVFAVPRSQITLLRGQSSRRKTVSIVNPRQLPDSCLISVS